jgi:hypothetical protein
MIMRMMMIVVFRIIVITRVNMALIAGMATTLETRVRDTLEKALKGEWKSQWKLKSKRKEERTQKGKTKEITLRFTIIDPSVAVLARKRSPGASHATTKLRVRITSRTSEAEGQSIRPGDSAISKFPLSLEQREQSLNYSRD